MRILVTGALGFIGSNLVKELRRRGHELIICDLAHQPDEVGFSLRSDSTKPNYARCDIGDYRQVERVFEKLGPFDFVYNCAAEFGRWNGEDFYENLWRTNVIGMKNILRLQERLNFKLVHFSSSEVYGDCDDLLVESLLDERPVSLLNDYAMTKWVNEMQIRNSAKVNGTQTVRIRLFNTYGPGEYYSPYRSANCRMLYCALLGRPWIVHRGHVRTSTFVGDTIRTLGNIVDNFKPGSVYNIAGGQAHSMEKLSEIVLNVSGASVDLVRFAEPEPMTTRAKIVNTAKAEEDLNHRCLVGLEEGMDRTFKWLKQIYAPNASCCHPS